MATINVTIEFDRPLDPADAAVITDMLQAAAAAVVKNAVAVGEELELTQTQQGEAWKLQIAPKRTTAKKGSLK